jgi:GlpG protein
MSAVPVLRLPLAVDLSGFVKLLQRMQVPHRVSEEAGEQVLWVPETISDDVRVLYERFPAGDPISNWISRWRPFRGPALSSKCAVAR